METRIIISKKEYDHLTDIEKNFDAKIAQAEEVFKKGLEEAVMGNLVKVLWTNDQHSASIIGCDLSDEGFNKFIPREAADKIDATSRTLSYNRNEVLKGNSTQGNSEMVEDHKEKYTKSFGLYKRIIRKQKRAICNLWWAFGMMFVAWLAQLIVYIMK